MKEAIEYYTKKNLWKSFKISLALALWVFAVSFNTFYIPALITVIVVTLSGPGIMAHDAAIKKSEQENGMDRL